MDFLTRHYEKLILGLTLICFVWSMFFIQGRESESSKELRKTMDSINSKVTASGYIKELDESKLPEIGNLLGSESFSTRLDVNPNNYSAKYNVAADAIKGNQFIDQENTHWTESTLLDPPRYVICKNTDCFTLIPFTAGEGSLVCPVCGEVQEVASPEPTLADDLDKDGIPDLIEQDYVFLDYRYSADAYQDYDGDGFSNLEEYKAGTDMEREEDMPALGYLVRIGSKPYHKKVPFKLERVKKNNSDDPRDWTAVMSDKNSYQAGQEVGRFKGYTVLSVGEASVTVTTPNGERIEMGKNKEVTEQATSVRLRFLRTRFGNSMMDGGMGMGNQMGVAQQMGDQMIEARINEEFELSVSVSSKSQNGMMGRGADNMGMPPVVANTDREIKEYYRVVSAENLTGDNGRPEIKVYIEKLSGKNGTRVELIEVKQFDRIADGMFVRQNSPMGGMM